MDVTDAYDCVRGESAMCRENRGSMPEYVPFFALNVVARKTQFGRHVRHDLPSVTCIHGHLPGFLLLKVQGCDPGGKSAHRSASVHVA